MNGPLERSASVHELSIFVCDIKQKKKWPWDQAFRFIHPDLRDDEMLPVLTQKYCAELMINFETTGMILYHAFIKSKVIVKSQTK